jgi:hypothetical protein
LREQYAYIGYLSFHFWRRSFRTISRRSDAPKVICGNL